MNTHISSDRACAYTNLSSESGCLLLLLQLLLPGGRSEVAPTETTMVALRAILIEAILVALESGARQ